MKTIIPPVLFILCIITMIGIKYLTPEQTFLSPPFNYAGIILIVAGLFFTIQVRKSFDKLNTEIHTFKRPRKLVIDGLFNLSRNPIYLGFTIALIGVWLLTGNLLAIIGVLVFFLTTNFWYIPYEEKVMEREFGDQYLAYKSKVRRWI